MVFSSQIFIFIFLPAALCGYFVIRQELRVAYLLLVSFIFYAWADPRLLLVLLAFIVINYLGGRIIQAIDEPRLNLRQATVITLVIINLGLLAYFKYFDFFLVNINHLLQLNLTIREIAIPLGISFFTFSGLSYILDIDSGKIQAEKNILKFALYMSFFPKLIQGPITRYEGFSPYLTEPKTTLDQFANGISRFVVGLSKKVLIADQLGAVVDQIFASSALNNSIPTVWLGAISYALQIFFDFSGYTDMAIGLGKMLGFELPENFNYPYISTSVTEFWRRWHMTLSSWFRDYVFYPLEFKRRRVKQLRIETNSLIVFFLTGLWHGASWNFILWGIWHGIVIAVESFTKSKRLNFQVPKSLQWLITMLVLTIGWVLFRSRDLEYAWQYFGVMFGIIRPTSVGVALQSYFNPKVVTILIIGIIACIPWKFVFPNISIKYEGTLLHNTLRFAGLIILFCLAFIYLISSATNSFIYFKF